MDYQQNMLASLQGGLNFGKQVKQIDDQRNINMLAGQAYGMTDPAQQQSLLGQMAMRDPAAAQQQQQAFAYDEQRRNTTMVNMARMLTSAPEQARAGLYQKMVPTLAQFGLSDMPQQYDAQTAPIINQAAQSLVSAYGMLDKNVPTDVRSFQQMTAGLSPEDRERARRINLGLDGRASNSGYSQVKFTDGQGRERIGVLNGRTGQIDLPDGTSFNPQTGAIAPTQAAQQTGGGLTTVGGQPAYIDPSLPPEVQAAIRAGAAEGVQDGGQMVVPGQQRVSNSPGTFIGRRAEDEAAAIEQAKTNVQLQNAPLVAAAEANAAGQKATASTTATEAAKRSATYITDGLAAADSLPVINRALDLLDTVGTGGIDRAKLAATNFFGVTGADEGELSQNLGKAVLSQLRATFGAQFTENEGARLASIEAGFGKSTAVNKRLLQQAKVIIERAARRGEQAARDSGDAFSADEIRRSMKMRLEAPAGAQPGSPKVASPVAGQPRAGTTEDGYRFRGGDPADPSNWERL